LGLKRNLRAVSEVATVPVIRLTMRAPRTRISIPVKPLRSFASINNSCRGLLTDCQLDSGGHGGFQNDFGEVAFESG